MGNRFSFLVRAQILCQALGAAGMRQDGRMEGRLSRSGELVRQTWTALWLEGTSRRIRSCRLEAGEWDSLGIMIAEKSYGAENERGGHL